MTDERYFKQARLMLRILPFIAKETCFALKGGTAINLFVRDMPRLSVDIDLTYLPVEGRKESLVHIGQALDRIAAALPFDYKVQRLKKPEAIGMTENVIFTSKLFIRSREGGVKIEPNIVFRGTVFSPETRTLVATAQDRFELSTSITVLSLADLYGGKICAALDRQHPRDLFDVMMLLNNEGITEEIRKAFIIYLAGHHRPMHELLHRLKFKNIMQEYESGFRGMTETDVSCEDLVQCQKSLPKMIKEQLSSDEKTFLLSLSKGELQWNLLGIKGIEELSALRWRLQKVQQMQKSERDEQLQKLSSVLEEI